MTRIHFMGNTPAEAIQNAAAAGITAWPHRVTRISGIWFHTFFVRDEA